MKNKTKLPIYTTQTKARGVPRAHTHEHTTRTSSFLLPPPLRSFCSRGIADDGVLAN